MPYFNNTNADCCHGVGSPVEVCSKPKMQLLEYKYRTSEYCWPIRSQCYHSDTELTKTRQQSPDVPLTCDPWETSINSAPSWPLIKLGRRMTAKTIFVDFVIGLGKLRVICQFFETWQHCFMMHYYCIILKCKYIVGGGQHLYNNSLLHHLPTNHLQIPTILPNNKELIEFLVCLPSGTTILPVQSPRAYWEGMNSGYKHLP